LLDIVPSRYTRNFLPALYVSEVWEGRSVSDDVIRFWAAIFFVCGEFLLCCEKLYEKTWVFFQCKMHFSEVRKLNFKKNFGFGPKKIIISNVASSFFVWQNFSTKQPKKPRGKIYLLKKIISPY